MGKKAKKLTYAQIAEKLSKLYEKYDNNLQNSVNDSEKNSAVRMLHRVSQNINQLVVDNQSAAMEADAKNPPASSPNQSIGRRTTMMAQNGGMPQNPNQNGLPWLLKNADMGLHKPGPTWMQSGYKHLLPEYQEQTGIGLNSKDFNSEAYKTWMTDEYHRQQLPYSYGERGDVQMSPNVKIVGPDKNPNIDLTNKRPIEKQLQDGGTAPTKRFRVKIGGSRLAGTKGVERIVSEAELTSLKKGVGMRGGNFEVLGEVSEEEWITVQKELKEKKALQLENKSLNDVNSMLSNLSTGVRDAMLKGYAEDPNYNVVDGKVIPIVTSDTDDAPGAPVVTPEDTPTNIPVLKPNKSGLYNNVTLKQLENYTKEAGIISGIGAEFDPKNSEHVTALQNGMLGGWQPSEGATNYLSGREDSFLNKGGLKSVNHAGVDGKFGTDTFNALKEMSKDIGLVNKAVNENKISPGNAIVPQDVKLFDIEPAGINNLLSTVEGPKAKDTGKGEGTEITAADGVAGKIGSGLIDMAGAYSKFNEYQKHNFAINNAQPPVDMKFQDPMYLNPTYNINPQLQESRDRMNLVTRGLSANSTMRNNVRNNLAGLSAAEQKGTNALYADKANKETQIRNMQTQLNAQAQDENTKRDYDNQMARRGFINDQNNARAKFATALATDAQDLITQRTDRRSQEAQMKALMPWLNSEGIFNRQYQDDDLLLRMLGLTKTKI